MRHTTPRAALLVAALLLAGTSACGKKDAGGDAASGTAAGTTTANSIDVTDVKLGKAVDINRRVTDETDNFKPADMIYASVLTSGTATSANVQARWTFEDGQLVDSATQVIAPTGAAATEFHIMKPGGWPKGKYKLTVLVNGTEAKSKEFKVD